MEHFECGSIRNEEIGPEYLFTHADLHDGIADERFVQIFIFLLLEAFDVLPGCLYKLPVDAITNRRSRRRRRAQTRVRTNANAAAAANSSYFYIYMLSCECE